MDTKRPVSKQPIPKYAQRVFKGKMFDVYQWEQEMFKGEKAIFEKIKRVDTVNVLPVTTDGKIILSEQEQPGLEPFVGVIGGRVDEGENPLEAVKRELLEETGYEAKKFILWEAIQLTEKVDWAIYTFVAKGCERVKKQEFDSGEKIKLKFVTFDELIKIASQDNYRDIEIALKLYKVTQNPEELEKARRLFSA